MSSAPRLGVNIDHIATLRQLRKTPYPDLMEAARLVENGGAHQITVHLREDRRHIQDEDVRALRAGLKIPLNLEMAASDPMLKIALKLKPDWACLVPEKRQEVTTEGGLDLKRQEKRIAPVVKKLRKAGIRVSLFIEPGLDAVKLSHKMGADAVEIHTGAFCLATQSAKKTSQSEKRAAKELERIEKAALLAKSLGLGAHVGHGLDYQNVRQVVDLRDGSGKALLDEYNIGHSIVCRAAIVGLERAVREMLSAVQAP